MEQHVNCEYSYYIDNDYVCKLTGQVCAIGIPDCTLCTRYDIEEEKRRNTRCNRQWKRED